MNIYERRNGLLGMELDRYMREHPEAIAEFHWLARGYLQRA
jgi:hypothetical protein